MSRRFQYKNIYNDPILGKFINYLMKGGKKSIAEKIIYKTFKILKLKFKDRVYFLFRKIQFGLRCARCVLQRA